MGLSSNLSYLQSPTGHPPIPPSNQSLQALSSNDIFALTPSDGHIGYGLVPVLPLE